MNIKKIIYIIVLHGVISMVIQPDSVSVDILSNVKTEINKNEFMS